MVFGAQLLSTSAKMNSLLTERSWWPELRREVEVPGAFEGGLIECPAPDGPAKWPMTPQLARAI